jgi:hypothetical protein
VREGKYYRPKGRSTSSSRSKIRFNEYKEIDSQINYQEVKDLVDALTGAPLNPLLGLHQCRQCKVFYQSNSLEVIRSENQGRCVSCLTPDIVSVTAQQRGRNADVSVITLQNFRQYEGRVITFEGHVYNVLVSQRGLDYAVMFENKSWTRGVKMVVFRGDVSSVGGRRFIMGLEGRTVRVRGLLIRHETFGYEIIVSDRAMILSVR